MRALTQAFLFFGYLFLALTVGAFVWRAGLGAGAGAAGAPWSASAAARRGVSMAHPMPCNMNGALLESALRQREIRPNPQPVL